MMTRYEHFGLVYFYIIRVLFLAFGRWSRFLLYYPSIFVKHTCDIDYFILLTLQIVKEFNVVSYVII